MSQSLLTSNGVLILALIFQLCHSTYSKPTGISMKMIMRDSPESPLYPGNLTRSQRLERLVRFSIARAQYLEISTSSNKSVVNPQGEAVMALYRNGYLFVVHFQIGTPPVSTYLVMDTGSSIVWTQCLPCPDCYPQLNAIYDSSSSITFINLPCSHPLCSGPRPVFDCNQQGKCAYTIGYVSGESTEGVAAKETVHFLHRDGTPDPVNDFIFGCTKKSAFKSWENTLVGGIMGLSWNQPSIAAQLGFRSFSYCLAGLLSDTPSELTFGDPAELLPPPDAPSTRFLPPRPGGNAFYYLDLRDISAGPTRLWFGPGTFDMTGPHGTEGGFIIDSGAALTHIANTGANPYMQVLETFRKFYDEKPQLSLRPMAEGEYLSLCYYYLEGFDQFASLTFHFDVADYVVYGKDVNLYFEDEVLGEYFCVAILPGSISTLGATHQQNTRIIYDSYDFSLKFYPENCS